MKKILAVLVLLLLVAAATVVPDKVKKASSVHEQKMFTAVESLGRSLRSLATGDNLKVAIYSPTAEFDEPARLWSVSGIVGVAVRSGGRDGPGPSGNELFEPFTAQLRNNCRNTLSSVCVRVETLTVGGARVLDIGQAAAIPGLSSIPVEARNRALPLIEMQAATRSGGASAVLPTLDRPAERMANPADTVRPASIDTANTSPPPPARLVAAEKAKQEAKASAGPMDSRTSPQPSPSRGTAAPEHEAVSSAVVMRIKRGLKRLGYDPGPTNNKVGPEAYSAIMAYQRRYELSLDGKPSLALLKHIESNKSDGLY